MNNKTYLADGVYAETDGFHIAVLRTERENNVEHWIALDDVTFVALLKFVERTQGCKITIEYKNEAREE